MAANDLVFHGTKTRCNVPGALPKRTSLLGIPFELRSQILEESLPDHERVNFSSGSTWAWKNSPQQRCLPGILLVSKQLHREASDILYRCNFIIEVNCSHCLYDRLWLRREHTANFPFHKAKQITLQVNVLGCCGPNLKFQHMVYNCGLLSSEGLTLGKLRVEFKSVPKRYDWSTFECTSWDDADRKKFAEDSGSTPGASPDDFDGYLAFLLQPLALIRVEDCYIEVSGKGKPNDNLERVFQHFQKTLVDQANVSCEAPRWIWDEYTSILGKVEEAERFYQRRELANHEEWLEITHKEYNCKHAGFGVKYREYDPS
ncbi:MAG: hypothetical protein Q9200_001258 [Gallowayella weberi]